MTLANQNGKMYPLFIKTSPVVSTSIFVRAKPIAIMDTTSFPKNHGDGWKQLIVDVTRNGTTGHHITNLS